MNARKYKTILQIVLIIVLTQVAFGNPVREATAEGNKLYEQGNFNEAINQYDQALVEAPQALEPKFNKANSYFRLDDLNNAMNLYREVAAESKDMTLVARAKYNLGNTYFQQGSKQKDSNLRKAIEDMETAIGSWRSALDIEPKNTKAAKNIEVARLTIKDLLDQLNKQQQDPNQPQDPNQSSQQNQQQQQQQGSQQDPNQPQDQQQQKQNPQEDPNQPQDPNQAEQKKQEQQKESQEEKEKRMAPDATAQEILDREQRQQKERQIY
ncbi:MAG: tetratricopeptide repeat protein, partial [Sedimentisphaerales bacterium]|nr:tetratricopeptide repeat protein [Sedimentisphaerales bacterium]